MGALAMVRGDTRTISVTINPTDVNGTPVLGSGGVTGWSFWMTAKRDPSDADSAAVFQKLPGQWQIQAAGNASTPAVVFTTLAPGDTSGLPAYQLVLAYDIQAKDVSGNVFTLDLGTLTISADVTNATT